MRASRTVPAALAFLACSPLGVLAQEHGEELGGGALFNINTGLSFWTLLVFAGLLFLLGKFAWGPILSAVEAREQGIQDALDEAQRRQAEASELLEEHRAQLADARRQANELIAQGRAAGEEVRKEMEERARAEAQDIVERARHEIERERDAALDSIRKESVELALAAASQVLRENLDQPKDRQLVERFLNQVSEGHGGAQA
jgi:F-type H+-transporting ATPase subunit b